MFSLEAIIFDLFGARDKAEDLFKDISGEGLHERFLKLIAKDLDDNEIALANLLVENTGNPFTCLDRFVPYREATFGTPPFVPGIPERRKFIALIKEANRRKGTKWGYTILFTILGMTSITITEYPPVYGFDSPGTFDDPGRVFDQKCRGCSKYSVALTGYAPLTASLIQSISSIIDYNEPINARLEDVTYNGVSIISSVLPILLQQNGGAILQEDGYFINI